MIEPGDLMLVPWNIGCVIGIDPGKNGGISCIDIFNDSLPSCYRMPDTVWDICELLTSFSADKPFVYIEKVGPFPGQGIASTGKFMKHAGHIEGIIVALKYPYSFVSPSKWQRGLGCLTKGDKNITKKMAQGLFSEIKITHAIADSLLISVWGLGDLLKRGIKTND